MKGSAPEFQPVTRVTPSDKTDPLSKQSTDFYQSVAAQSPATFAPEFQPIARVTPSAMTDALSKQPPNSYQPLAARSPVTFATPTPYTPQFVNMATRTNGGAANNQFGNALIAALRRSSFNPNNLENARALAQRQQMVQQAQSAPQMRSTMQAPARSSFYRGRM